MKHDFIRLAYASAIAALAFPACDMEWETAEDGPQPTYAEHVAYGESGSLVVFTSAGIMLHDAALASRVGAIELDASASGRLRDVPFSFAMSDDGRVAAVTFSNTERRDVVLYDLERLREVTALDIESSRDPVQGVALLGAHDGSHQMSSTVVRARPRKSRMAQRRSRR